MNCPHCNEVINDWYWIRFEGIGPWKDKNTYWGCPKCKKRFDGSEIPKVIDNNKHKGPTAIIQEPNGIRSY